MDTSAYNAELLVSLARITFLSLKEKCALLKKLDTPADLALLSIEELSKIVGRKISASWNGKENFLQAKKELAVISSKKIGMLFYEDSRFPALLREVSNAPFLLFYRGNVSCLGERTVSVVGTRKITAEAKKEAMSFAFDAVKDGCTVVSGLAYGVDGASHSGAVNALLEANDFEKQKFGKTVAVLPCGIDTVTPYANRTLACKILESGGCIISEYVPGTEAKNWRFVQRNRIIAALSPATVVIQAPQGSGALITADFALEYGRDVVFHTACFSDSAKKVSSHIKSNLEVQFALGDISRSKLEHSVENYIESGAPVVSSYRDFCNYTAEIPGLRNTMIFEERQPVLLEI